MARIWTSAALNMDYLSVRSGTVEVYNSRNIVISSGSLTGTYSGQFTYDNYGNVFGKLNSYTNAISGNLVFSVTGLDLNAYTVMNYVENSDSALYRYALGGNDQFSLSNGSDRIRAYDGNDYVSASGGNDYIDGGIGHDTLVGAAGNDTIIGGDGRDHIYSGGGRDNLTGGLGGDRFVFTAPGAMGRGAGRDTISDFRHNVDLIDISEIDANTRAGGDQAFRFIGDRDFTGKAGQLRYENGVLRGDINGDGETDFALNFSNFVRLDAGDFAL